MISTVLPKSHIRALLEYGLVYDRKRGMWDGYDYCLSEDDVMGLDLWELDQVLAGLRDRRSSVRVKAGIFYLLSED